MRKKQQDARRKKIKRSPWPRGWARLIHPKNNPLSELPDSHPAKMVLFAHGQCRRDCVGKEIPWRGHESEAFDQEWRSQLTGRKFLFSSYAYMFISFDLILEEWLNHPPHATESEKQMFGYIKLQNALLDECEQAATKEDNTRILALLPQIRKYNDLRLQAITERWRIDELQPSEIPTVNEVLEKKGWQPTQT